MRSGSPWVERGLHLAYDAPNASWRHRYPAIFDRTAEPDRAAFPVRQEKFFTFACYSSDSVRMIPSSAGLVWYKE